MLSRISEGRSRKRKGTLGAQAWLGCDTVQAGDLRAILLLLAISFFVVIYLSAGFGLGDE
jgi:hypothetical protein